MRHTKLNLSTSTSTSTSTMSNLVAGIKRIIITPEGGEKKLKQEDEQQPYQQQQEGWDDYFSNRETVKIVIVLDTTASMSAYIEGILNVLKDLMAVCELYEGLSVSLVFFRDIDFKNNGIVVHDNVRTIEEARIILGNIEADGGGPYGYEASSTALLTALDKCVPDGSASLVYLITDEGGRMYKSASKDEEKDRNIEAYKGGYSAEKLSAAYIAKKLDKKKAKLMVLSPKTHAYDKPGFRDLREESLKFNQLYSRVQLLHYCEESEKKHVAQCLLKTISVDIMATVAPMDTAFSQSLYGAKLTHLGEFGENSSNLGLPEAYLNKLKECVQKRVNTNTKVVEDQTKHTDWLHFSILPDRDRFCILMANPNKTKVDAFVDRILNRSKAEAATKSTILSLLAESDMGVLVRDLVDKHASNDKKQRYASTLRSCNGSNNTKALQEQQKQRFAINAMPVVHSAINNCCENSGEGIFYLSNKVLHPGKRVQDVVNITHKSTLKWMEETLLPEIQYRSPTNTLSINEVLDDGRMLCIPSKPFIMDSGEEVNPIQLLPSLVYKDAVIKHAKSITSLVYAAMIVKNEGDTYCHQLVVLAKAFMRDFDYKEYMLPRPEIHNGSIRSLLLSQNVRAAIPKRAISNYLMASLQLSNILILIEKNEKNPFMLKHTVARLTERKRDVKLLHCAKCLEFKYPEYFAPDGLNTEHSYCNYCAITEISNRCKVTQDIVALLFDREVDGEKGKVAGEKGEVDGEKGEVAGEKGKVDGEKGEKGEMYGLPPEFVKVTKPKQRHTKENEESFRTFLTAKVCKIEECTTIELICQECTAFYPAWNIDRVPTSFKEHVCPLCRATMVLNDSSLAPIFTKYVRAVEARHMEKTTNHLLNIDFIAFYRLIFFSEDKQCISTSEDEQCISTLAKWLKDEINNNNPNEEDVVSIAKYYEPLTLQKLISAKALEELYKIETGIKLDFLNSDWNFVSSLRSCYNIFNDANVNAESVRQYTEDEFRKVIEDGHFATNEDTLARIEDILPKQMLNKDQFLKLEACGLCLGTENNTVVKHCNAIKMCDRCIYKMIAAAIADAPVPALAAAPVLRCPACKQPLTEEFIVRVITGRVNKLAPLQEMAKELKKREDAKPKIKLSGLSVEMRRELKMEGDETKALKKYYRLCLKNPAMAYHHPTTIITTANTEMGHLNKLSLENEMEHSDSDGNEMEHSDSDENEMEHSDFDY